MKELELINEVRRRFAGGSGRAVRLGIGDDCAILRTQPGHETVVTTDFTLEGRHFRRDLHPPESVGHRCLARGLSDIAAMGATPIAAFLSLAVPSDLMAKTKGRAWIERFFNGLGALAKRNQVPLAGGDTAESPGNAVLADIVLLGSLPAGKALRRSGAKAGETIYVTGALGGSATELQSMLAGNNRKKSARIIRTKIFSTADHPQMFPEPRIVIGEVLRRRGLATACIDISDGLSTDLAHLCRASGVAAEIDSNAIPLHPLARTLQPAAALDAALHGGEDYELLFSAPASVHIPRKIAGISITRIGKFVPKSAKKPMMTLISPENARATLEPGGWEHFSHRR
ncbi:MAG TPA: thiamine-phosphate kinase [Edaphobacter sp.]|nr:thiamine-phosphate kinase [Edaphobacter sp.]